MLRTVPSWLFSGWICIGLGFTFIPNAWAATIYSYIDEQGNLASTDRLETIPEKYRAKVKTHEATDPVPQPQSRLESVQKVAREQMKNVGLTVPSVSTSIAGDRPTMAALTTEQSKILTDAGLAGVALLLMMYLSKSQFIRLLGLSLLIVMGIGVPVLMYVGDDGPVEMMKNKTTSAGQAQQDRLP